MNKEKSIQLEQVTEKELLLQIVKEIQELKSIITISNIAELEYESHIITNETINSTKKILESIKLSNLTT
jgi:hypothetical protein